MLLVRGADDKGRYGLHRVDARTGALIASYRRPNGGGSFGLAIAPDAKSVYYRTFTGDKDEYSQIMALNFATGVERELYRFKGNMGWASPSPDGRQLAFSVLTPYPSERASIYVMPAEGGTPREVVRLPDGVASHAGSGPIAWTQTGHLLFVGTEPNASAHNVWQVPVSGGDARKLAVEMPAMKGLRLHPDGRRIVFDGGERSVEIWTMDVGSRP
jgi:Tol biopolymer transport system component